MQLFFSVRNVLVLKRILYLFNICFCSICMIYPFKWNLYFYHLTVNMMLDTLIWQKFIVLFLFLYWKLYWNFYGPIQNQSFKDNRAEKKQNFYLQSSLYWNKFFCHFWSQLPIFNINLWFLKSIVQINQLPIHYTYPTAWGHILLKKNPL